MAKPANAGTGLSRRLILTSLNVRSAPDSIVVLRALTNGERVTFYPATERAAGGKVWAYIEAASVNGWVARINPTWEAQFAPVPVEPGLVSPWLSRDEIQQLATMHRRMAEILEAAIARTE